MTSATTAEHTVDSILDQLGHFHQRATYGAVAGVVDTSPRSLMTGRERNERSSWIVGRQSSLPTGYTPEQTHPDIGERERVLSSPEELRVWLANPS
jgi:hypothetical protein